MNCMSLDDVIIAQEHLDILQAYENAHHDIEKEEAQKQKNNKR